MWLSIGLWACAPPAADVITPPVQGEDTSTEVADTEDTAAAEDTEDTEDTGIPEEIDDVPEGFDMLVFERKQSVYLWNSEEPILLTGERKVDHIRETPVATGDNIMFIVEKDSCWDVLIVDKNGTELYASDLGEYGCDMWTDQVGVVEASGQFWLFTMAPGSTYADKHGGRYHLHVFDPELGEVSRLSTYAELQIGHATEDGAGITWLESGYVGLIQFGVSELTGGTGILDISSNAGSFEIYGTFLSRPSRQASDYTFYATSTMGKTHLITANPITLSAESKATIKEGNSLAGELVLIESTNDAFFSGQRNLWHIGETAESVFKVAKTENQAIGVSPEGHYAVRATPRKLLHRNIETGEEHMLEFDSVAPWYMDPDDCVTELDSIGIGASGFVVSSTNEWNDCNYVDVWPDSGGDPPECDCPSAVYFSWEDVSPTLLGDSGRLPPRFSPSASKLAFGKYNGGCISPVIMDLETKSVTTLTDECGLEDYFWVTVDTP